MKYEYYFTTNRKVDGYMGFDDFLEAVNTMNKHAESTAGILTAEIIDNEKKTVICSRRSAI